MSDNPAVHRAGTRMPSGLVPVVVASVMLTLGFTWTRGVRVLGQDSFAYVDMVKAFARDFPDRFGDWWPYGYPVSALPLYWLGLSAFTALLLITFASFVFMLTVTGRCLPPDGNLAWRRRAIIIAVALSPVSAQLMVFDLADPFFAAALVGLAAALAHWPERWAVVAAPILALAAFGIRYAGVFTFGLIGLFAWLRWRELRASGVVIILAASSIVIAAITAGLLWTNVRAFGHITGPQPMGESSIWSWPVHLADLGLALPAAFGSTHLVQSLQHSYRVPAMIAGLAIMGAIAMLIVSALLRPATRYTTAFAWVAGGYLVTIVTLRAVTPFPELSYPRYLFPAMFPLAILVVSHSGVARSRLVAAAAMASIVVSAGLAARGIAPDQRTDLASVRTFLSAELRPDDVITVNLPGRHLAAYFDNRFDFVGYADGFAQAWTVSSTNWQPRRTALTVVVARGPEGERAFDRGELAAVLAAVEAGDVDLVFKDPQAVVVRARPIRQNEQ